MKVTSKQADAALAKITSAMQRNTFLATGKGSAHSAAPVATYTPAPPSNPAAVTVAKTQAPPMPGRWTSGLRLRAQDMAKIHEMLQASLALGVQINTSDAIRIALRAYEPKHLATADIARIRAADGRYRSPRASAS